MLRPGTVKFWWAEDENAYRTVNALLIVGMILCAGGVGLILGWFG